MWSVHIGHNNTELRIFKDLLELSVHAAARFVELALDCVKRQGEFTVCLSGGSTPVDTYDLLGREPHRSAIPWGKVHIFWGDERCIPLDRPDNHYTLASELFLRKVRIPKSNIHRMRGEADDPTAAADEYQAMLQSFFKLSPGTYPRFDLILLGMGEDGHTASLYPGTRGLEEQEGLVAGHYVPQRKGFRLTLTLPVLCNAAQVMFMVSGKSKATALRSVLRRPDEKVLPAQMVRPLNGTLVWLVDEAAAGELNI